MVIGATAFAADMAAPNATRPRQLSPPCEAAYEGLGQKLPHAEMERLRSELVKLKNGAVHDSRSRVHLLALVVVSSNQLCLFENFVAQVSFNVFPDMLPVVAATLDAQSFDRCRALAQAPPTTLRTASLHTNSTAKLLFCADLSTLHAPKAWSTESRVECNAEMWGSSAWKKPQILLALLELLAAFAPSWKVAMMDLDAIVCKPGLHAFVASLEDEGHEQLWMVRDREVWNNGDRSARRPNTGVVLASVSHAQFVEAWLGWAERVVRMFKLKDHMAISDQTGLHMMVGANPEHERVLQLFPDSVAALITSPESSPVIRHYNPIGKYTPNNLCPPDVSKKSCSAGAQKVFAMASDGRWGPPSPDCSYHRLLPSMRV